MSRRSWAILQHVEFEGPGLIADELAARGRGYRVYRQDAGDGVRAPESFGGLVVMGGPMGVHDGAQHPFLEQERELLQASVARGVPVLGVCLGAQLLAAALGAEVTTGAAPEIGPGEVQLTDLGQRDPVLGGEGATLPVVHWHQDTFAIPDGAVWLARSGQFPHQAFRMGESAYGLQFHCEVNRALAREWQPRLPAGVTLDDAHIARVAACGRRIIGRFLDLA
jgi:GMP synthase-like glutamine amidotransferase